MKKFFALALALIMVLSLVACGGSKKEETKEETKTETTETTEESGYPEMSIRLAHDAPLTTPTTSPARTSRLLWKSVPAARSRLRFIPTSSWVLLLR